MSRTGCRTCDDHLDVAREFDAIAEQRRAGVRSAEQRAAEARGRYTDHAAQHPYRSAGGES